MKLLNKDTVPLACFFLFALWLDTRLIYQMLAPPVQFRWDFLASALSRPGGLVDVAVGLLGQLLFFRLPGALALTVLAGLLLFLAGRTTRLLNGGRDSFVRYVPLFVFTAMVSTYYFVLESVLATVMLLLLAIFWMSRMRWPAPARAGALALLTALFYFTAAGMPALGLLAPGRVHAVFLLAGWALLCLGFEWSRRRPSGWRGVVEPAWLIPVLIIVPLLGEWYFFSPATSFWGGLSRFDPGVFFWQSVLSLLMSVSVGLMVLGVAAATLLAAVPRRSARPGVVGKWMKALCSGPLAKAGPLVLLLAAGLLPRWEVNAGVMPSHMLRQALRVSQLVRAERYEEALDLSSRLKAGGSIYLLSAAAYDIDLALHKTGRLLDEVFLWPRQDLSLIAYLDSRRGAPAYLLERMVDCVFRLGRLNDAEHYAYELLAIAGPRPDVFWHLARIHMVKNEPETARIYLNILAGDLIHCREALRYLELLEEDPGLNDVEEISRWRERMLLENDLDRISIFNPAEGGYLELPDERLLSLIERDPSNRMALDFLLASYLLWGESARIAENARWLTSAGYGGIPRRVQEALLIHQLRGGVLPEYVARGISPNTEADFQGFLFLRQKLLGERDPFIWTHSLRRFHGSYWFHLFFFLNEEVTGEIL